MINLESFNRYPDRKSRRIEKYENSLVDKVENSPDFSDILGNILADCGG